MLYATLIRDGQEMIQNTSFIPRKYTFPQELLGLHKIISFVGARRVGKSTIMKQVLHELVAAGTLTREQVVWIDGNEINPYQFSIEELVTSYLSLHPGKEPFFVIDEAHELPDRIRTLFFLYNKGRKIFISGSNAHMFSSEISTKLRGKVYDQRISGLDREEFCLFHSFTFDHSTHSIAERNRLFEEYLTWGGFPEIALTSSTSLKSGVLKNYFDVLVYKDLIERYSIDKEFVIKYLIKYISSTLTKEFSVQNGINQLKSQGVSLSAPSLYNYLEYLQNIFFMSPLTQKRRQRGSIKRYLEDTGYISLREKEGLGKRFENFIINQYKKQYESLHRLQTKSGEIDCITDDASIQICRYLTSENQERECKPLLNDSSAGKKILIYYKKDPGLLLDAAITYRDVFDFIEGIKV